MSKYCKHCGKELRDEAVFCKYCGADVEDAVLNEIRESGSESESDEAESSVEIKSKRKSYKIFVVVLGVIVLAAIAAAALYYFGAGTPGGSNEPGKIPQDTETTKATEPVDNAAPLEASIFFASDYGEQEGWEEPKETLSQILSKAQADGKNPNCIIMLGDYNSVKGKNNYELDPEDSTEEIRDEAQTVFPDLISSDFIFVQGNVDKWSSSLSGSRLHEFDNYLVYVLNTENDFPWSQGKNKDSLKKVKKASAKMKECFNELIAQGEKRPVFVASHMPLHFTARTASKTGDNMYASLFFDVINDAAKDLDIVYLYGHNCAKGWDCYLGGSSVFKPVGDTLLIPDYREGDKSTDKYSEETLNFTYLNGGYIGYYMNCSQDDLESGKLDKFSAADETLTGTICEIYSDKIVLTRYAVDGVHPLGWNGEADPFDGYIDKDLIDSSYYSDKTESPQVIDRK